MLTEAYRIIRFCTFTSSSKLEKTTVCFRPFRNLSPSPFPFHFLRSLFLVAVSDRMERKIGKKDIMVIGSLTQFRLNLISESDAGIYFSTDLNRSLHHTVLKTLNIKLSRWPYFSTTTSVRFFSFSFRHSSTQKPSLLRRQEQLNRPCDCSRVEVTNLISM